MEPKDHLKKIFTKLSRAHHDCGERYVDHDLDKFSESLTNESFFALSAEQQLSTLHWYDEAFLGRGSRLTGLIHAKRLTQDFYSEMEKAILGYLVTTNISNEVKEKMRSRLGNLD